MSNSGRDEMGDKLRKTFSQETLKEMENTLKAPDAINRSLQRVEALRASVLQSVERVRGFNNEADRVNIADSIARAYDEVIRILREERRR